LLLSERRDQPNTAGNEIMASSERKHFPISSAQRRFWFLERLMAIPGAYTIDKAIRLKGSLHIPALRQTLTEIQRRHEALRTTFDFIGDDLRQIIHPPQEFELPVKDLSNLSVAAQQLEIRRLTEAETMHPFDLRTGPLLRAQLLRLAHDEHVMLVAMHHIISDGWSLAIFLREMATLYETFRLGRRPRLPELKVQYADFVLWQQEFLRSEAGEKQRAYWTRKLAGMPPSLLLPTDRPRSTTRSLRGAMESIILTAGFRESLHAFSREHNATLFMVLLSAFNVLLFRYSNQEEFAVGSPIANRRRSETESLIGAFINTLVFRSKVERSLRVRDLIKQVRMTALEAFSNQDFPFEEMVAELNPERALNEQPLFQVLLVLRNEPTEAIKLPGLELTFLPHTRISTALDLNFSIHEIGNELSCWMLYDAELFDQSSIKRLLQHFRNVLQSMVEGPGQCVGEVEMLGQDERQQLVTQWNCTSVNYEKKHVHEWFEEQAKRLPDAIAVDCERQQLTYKELDRRSSQLARYLQMLGVSAEVRVGISAERSLEMVVGLLGILKAGGAYVPLDPSYPAERLKFMVEDARVQVLLTQQHLLGTLPPHTAHVLCLDSEWEVIARQSSQRVGVELSDHNLAYIIYTSGSTGRPKGAMNTHGGMRNRLLWMQELYRLNEDDRVLQKTPFSFDVSVWEFFWPLMTGARLVMSRPGGHKDPAYLVRLIQEAGITTVHFVPSMLQAFLAEPEVKRCTSLRRVICSGEALPLQFKEQFFAQPGCELHNLYGPTEASIDVTFWECRREDGLPVVPIGRPIANTQVYVLDEWMNVMPIGIPGELYLGGEGLARGYWQRPDLTAEKFVPNPFSDIPGQRLYQTGDLVRWREAGYLEYLGRLDHQVKIRGFRIELGEIEAVLLQCPNVRESVVVVREDYPGDKRLVAYVTAKERDRGLETQELSRYLQEKLPNYMAPSAFVILDALPISPNGKIERSKLPAPEIFRPIPDLKDTVPETDVEKQILRAWQEILHLENIGVTQNLFDLGANSLHSVRMQNMLKQRLNRDIELLELFRFPTIRSLAAHLSQPGDQNLIPDAPHITALNAGQERLRRQRTQLRPAPMTD
jgi:amino acid adenylation domain-containing protein